MEKTEEQAIKYPIDTEFVECDTCKLKSGSPTLCNGCLKNRQIISVLVEYLNFKTLSYQQIERLNKRANQAGIKKGIKLAMERIGQNEEEQDYTSEMERIIGRNEERSRLRQALAELLKK